MTHALHVVGARPNFMKVSPVLRALAPAGVRQTLVHTGQHYDTNMSASFFAELGIPEPDINLGVGSGSHAAQTAEIMVGIERCLLQDRPDLVLVYGDVNSTMAAALVASKLGVRVAHVEAGLRSGDRSMPEEINRVVTDRVADVLFTPSEDGNANLVREGADPASVHLVGNVMIDTLVRLLPAADTAGMLARFCLTRDGAVIPFVLVTLHRPSNVDDPHVLGRLLAVLAEIAETTTVVFPVHPRTRARLGDTDGRRPGLMLVEPLGYLEFLALQRKAALVITDSGGIQEETTYLGVPCLTVRDNTERPITISLGTNVLVGRDPDRLRKEARRVLGGDVRRGTVPPLWDGRAGERIAGILLH